MNAKLIRACLCVLFISLHSLSAMSEQSVADFRNTIESSEHLYLDLESSKNITLDEKLDALDLLYAYKEKWADLQDDDAQTLFLPLTKEVIRRLENHLETEYDWKQQGYVGRTLKPLLVTGSIFVITLLLAKLFEWNEWISVDTYSRTKWVAGASMPPLLLLWILYNYQPELYRFGREKKEIT